MTDPLKLWAGLMVGLDCWVLYILAHHLWTVWDDPGPMGVLLLVAMDVVARSWLVPALRILNGRA